MSEEASSGDLGSGDNSAVHRATHNLDDLSSDNILDHLDRFWQGILYFTKHEHLDSCQLTQIGSSDAVSVGMDTLTICEISDVYL